VLESIIRFLVLKYGTDVLDWSMRKIMQTWESEPDKGIQISTNNDCDRALNASPLGYRLDPDCGVFYWELPSKEM